MRYITIPEPIEVKVVLKDGETKTFEYSFDDLHVFEVWPNRAWRAGDASHSAFFRIYQAFAGKLPGNVVELSDDDYEIWLPIVTMRGQDLRVELAYAMMQLMAAAFTASTSPPKVVEKVLEPASLQA